jgi:hypothetical protein
MHSLLKHKMLQFLFKGLSCAFVGKKEFYKKGMVFGFRKTATAVVGPEIDKLKGKGHPCTGTEVLYRPYGP